MEHKKYVMTDKAITTVHPITGRPVVLHQIKREYGKNKGELGGWIEGEYNLSQDGNCWIDKSAIVFDNSVIFGNAQISGYTQVFGGTQISNNSIIRNSIIHNSIIFDSGVFDSTVLNSKVLYSNVLGSKILENSEVFKSYISISTFLNSKFSNSRAYFSNVLDSNVYGTRVSNSSIRSNSQIFNSDIYKSKIYSSYIDATKVYNSTVVENMKDNAISSELFEAVQQTDKAYSRIVQPIIEKLKGYVVLDDFSNEQSIEDYSDCRDESYSELEQPKLAVSKKCIAKDSSSSKNFIINKNYSNEISSDLSTITIDNNLSISKTQEKSTSRCTTLKNAFRAIGRCTHCKRGEGRY